MPTVRGVQGRDLRRRVRIPVRDVFALRYIPWDDPVIIINVVVVAMVSDGYSASIVTEVSEFVHWGDLRKRNVSSVDYNGHSETL